MENTAEPTNPQTIAELKALERPECDEITDASLYEERDGVSISMGSSGFGVSADRCPDGKLPEWFAAMVEDGSIIGKRGCLYTHQGSMTHGFDVEDREVYWLTPLEREAERAAHLAESDRDRREKFARDKPDLDRRFEALPPEFKARIARRRRNNPDFRVEWEGYELFTCEQAVAFAHHALKQVGCPDWIIDDEGNRAAARQPDGKLGATYADKAVEWLVGWQLVGESEQAREKATAEADKDWAGWVPLSVADKEYDARTQHELMPAMSDQHSGNTFGGACYLAKLYLVNPEGVDKLHGVGAALVGSEEYGDVDREATPA